MDQNRDKMTQAMSYHERAMNRRKTKPKILPPHVRNYRTTCPQCGRTYEGNFPMWVQIGPFPCICGATVPAPRNQAFPFDE
jgi:hypothetical protein